MVEVYDLILVAVGVFGFCAGMLLGSWLETPKRDIRGRFTK